MKKASLFLFLGFVSSVASGQMPPPMTPVDDVSKLANPANRTIEKDHRIKNLVPEKTPSGMTVYREAPQKPQNAPSVASPSAAGLTPEEAKQFREAEQRARQQRLNEQQIRQPNPKESLTEPATAHLSALFDIEKHCNHIGSMATGGSYVLERACRNQEREALSELSSMRIPPEIEKHCAHIGSMSAGGSYNLMRACVKQEIEAKESLR